MTQRRLTKEEAAQVRALVDRGVPDKIIAQQFGVTLQAISDRRKTWGLRTPRLGMKYHKSDRRVQGELLILEGAQSPVVVRQCGVTRETARRWRAALGQPPSVDTTRCHDARGRFCSPQDTSPSVTQRVGKSIAEYVFDRDDHDQDKMLRQLEAEYRRGILRKMEALMSQVVSVAISVAPPQEPSTECLPDVAAGFTKHFTIGESDGYLHVTEYADGRVGRIAITMAKAGDKDRAFLEVACTQATNLLQHGVPLSSVLGTWRGTRFAPDGRTGEKGATAIHSCTSPLDFVARFLIQRYRLE